MGINTRRQTCGKLEIIEVNIDTSGHGKKDIRDRNFSRLRLKLRNMILGAYRNDNSLNILLCLDFTKIFSPLSWCISNGTRQI